MTTVPPPKTVFISHAHEDKALARELKNMLKGHHVPAWLDEKQLKGGDALTGEIKKEIKNARALAVLVTQAAFNSPWVRKEVRWARDKGVKVIPLTRSGVEPDAVKKLIGKGLLCIPIADGTDGLQEAMPQILSALELSSPDSAPGPSTPETRPVAELVLLLRNPGELHEDGKRRVKARAELQYQPGHGGRSAQGAGFDFIAPLGPIERREISWYLEIFPRWPGEAFRMQAEKVEQALPRWGKALFAAAQDGKKLWAEWERDGAEERRLTVKMDETFDDAHRQGLAAELLALPWELLHGERGYLFHGERGARVRRGMVVSHSAPPVVTDPPLRVLVLSPRPEDDTAKYIDHRVSVAPLVKTLAGLGALAELTILEEPTLSSLIAALDQARKANTPFHVVHFDGHGVYLPGKGLGALCFEAPDQREKIFNRASDLVDAEELAQMLKDFRIPLIFLEACQGAKADKDPASSVATALLNQGVATVAAMSHSVLVITAQEFVTVFYQELAEGKRVGAAMLAGQRHLFDHPKRGYWLGAGELELQDWFVPVLYQEEEDPPLIRKLPSDQARELINRRHETRLEALPPPPPHDFVGRGKELLAIERLLLVDDFAVLLGEGGEGKTALACEAARWLAQIHRVGRVAFVSLEKSTHHKAVLDELGRQLVGKNYSIAGFTDLEQAWLPIERALREEPWLLVLDNMETVLPPRPGAPQGMHDPEELSLLLSWFRRLAGVKGTRLLFTSQERMPAPFDAGRNRVDIGALDPWDGVELIRKVMQRKNRPPFPGKSRDGQEQALLDLVASVHGHARTLVLLAPDLATREMVLTTAELHRLMAGLEQRHPGERERSLYAGVALSLNRLSPATRELIRPLGVFQGGGHFDAIAQVLGIKERERLHPVVAELVQTGLCDEHEYDYLTFHIALCPFLWGEMGAAEQEAARGRWLEGEEGFLAFLYEQRSQDARLAAGLTLRDLPNLLTGLERAEGAWPVERAMAWATRMATLLQELGRRGAEQRVAAARQRLGQRLGEGWSSARFQHDRAHVEALAGAGRMSEARDAALSLLARCQQAGEQVYPGADYDLAMAHKLAGDGLYRSGNATAAVPLLREARTRFHALGAAGHQMARKMAAAALSNLGDCLQDLELEEAARCYELAAQESEAEGNRRGVAVSRGQLGTVRLLQERYDEALAAHAEARQTMDEPASVATGWHQTGMVYQEMQAWDQAEEAYREALKIMTSHGLDRDVGATLTNLAALFSAQGKWEEAVVHYRNVLDIHVRLGDPAREGKVHNNLANTLRQLGRLDEAREEARRAIACMEPFGHAAKLWKTWNILAEIETAAHHPEAAAQARQEARALFAQYRRDGGENPRGARRFQGVAAAIQQGAGEQARAQLEGLAQHPGMPPKGQALIPVLLAILSGNRDPALAQAPGLDYDDAVEVELLLDSLS